MCVSGVLHLINKIKSKLRVFFFPLFLLFPAASPLSQSCKDSQTPTVEWGDLYASFNIKCLLKAGMGLGRYVIPSFSIGNRKALEAASCLRMMGSGKTTVGKVLAEALGYSFIDSDLYLEQAIGGLSVAQIFNDYGEKFFREKESEALHELSSMPCQVIGTGGGAVVQSDNWNYMKRGVTVFLDVPLDTLARRIAAVGTNSRPLMHCNSGDAYTTAFVGLFTLVRKRSDAYAKADARVSVYHLSVNMGLEDICDLTPTAIAMEGLECVEKHLKGNGNTSTPILP